MSGCEKFQELISRMIDEDLDRAERALLAEHLKTCADCRRMYAAFSALSMELGGDLEEPPEDLRENVMAQLRRPAFRLQEPEEEIRSEKIVSFQTAQSRKKSSRGRNPYRGFVAVAASLALIVGASFLAAPLLRMSSGAAVKSGGAPDRAMAPAAYPSIGGEDAVIMLEGGMAEAAPAERAIAEAAPEAAEAEEYALYEHAAPAATHLPQPAGAPAAASAQTADDAGGTLSIAAPTGGSAGVVCSYVELWDEGRQSELQTLLKGSVRPISVPVEGGGTVEEEDLAASLVYVLSLDEKGERQISVYVDGGVVYYLDSAEGILRKAACTPEKLAEFIF